MKIKEIVCLLTWLKFCESRGNSCKVCELSKKQLCDGGSADEEKLQKIIIYNRKKKLKKLLS